MQFLDAMPSFDDLAEVFGPSTHEVVAQALPQQVPTEVNDIPVEYAYGPQSIPPDQRVDLPPDELDLAVGNAKFNLITKDPEQVAIALNTLENLSDGQRVEALAQLSKAERDSLLANTPPEHRERLSQLVGATEDRDFKVGLWGEGEKAKLEREAGELDAELEAMKASGVTDPAEIALMERRIAAARGGIGEVDHEMAATKAGEAEVHDVIARKARERELEIRYGMNLTNEEVDPAEASDPWGGLLPPDKRRVWSVAELDQLDRTLDRLPPEQLELNPELKEIHRASSDDSLEQMSKGQTKGGMYSSKTGVLNMYDGAWTSAGRLRNETSELAGHDGVSAFEELVIHELGHASADMSKQAGDDQQLKYAKAAGWKVEPKDTPLGNHDGRYYVEMDGHVVSIDEDRVPADAAHTPDPTPGSCQPGDQREEDPWWYARYSPREHFAETYTKAINAPELLHQDLIERPKARVEAAQKARDEALAGGDPIALAEAEARFADAQADQTAMAEQHKIMREGVFKMSQEQVDLAAGSLGASSGPIDPERQKVIDEFRARAEAAMTPDQLERLRAQYARRLGTS